jgi:hypothetical protein
MLRCCSACGRGLQRYNPALLDGCSAHGNSSVHLPGATHVGAEAGVKPPPAGPALHVYWSDLVPVMLLTSPAPQLTVHLVPLRSVSKRHPVLIQRG